MPSKFATVEFPLPNVGPLGIDVASDQKTFVTTGGEFHRAGQLVRWDIASMAATGNVDFEKAGTSWVVKYSRDGKQFVVDQQSKLSVLNSKTLRSVGEYAFSDEFCTTCADWNSANDVVVFSRPHGSGNVHLWRVGANRLWRSASLPSDFVAFLSDDRFVVAAREQTIEVWDTKTGNIRKITELSNWKTDWAFGLTPQRDVLIAVSNTGEVREIETKNWKAKKSTGLRKARPRIITTSPDGRRIAVKYEDGGIVIWNRDEAAVVARWKDAMIAAHRMAFVEDGERLLITRDDGGVVLLDFRQGAVDQARECISQPSGMLRCVPIALQDNRLDETRNRANPENTVPIRCEACHFPDIDFVPQPYLLTKGISRPAELGTAQFGNFFVRDAAKKVLEVAAPGQCDFFPTVEFKTNQPTPWHLAVPRNLVHFFDVKKSVPRCKSCGEPLSAHSYTEFEAFPRREYLAPFDVFKSQEWSSLGRESNTPKKRTQLWRDLFFSVRLETLFKRLNLGGIRRDYDSKDKPAPEDLAWIEEQLARLNQQSSTVAKKQGAKSTLNPDKWFKSFLARYAAKSPKEFDLAAIKRKQGFSLPKSFIDFSKRSRKLSFQNVDGEVGYTVRVQLPNRLNLRDHRREVTDSGSSNEDQIDGVGFAVAINGDEFCFNLTRTSGTDYAVYWFNHEMGNYEPYAANFIEFLKRVCKED